MENKVIEIFEGLFTNAIVKEMENDTYMFELRVIELDENNEYLDTFDLEMEIDENDLPNSYIRIEGGFEGNFEDYIIHLTFKDFEEVVNEIGVEL